MKKLKINETMKPYIRSIKPFRFLTEEEMNELIEHSEVRQYSDEEIIIKQGNRDSSLYAVMKGSVKVTVDNPNDTAYICTLGASEVFGEAGIFINMERTANVVSMDDAIILYIERESLLNFIKHNPKASNKVFMIMIYSLLQKLKESNRELAYERKSDFDQDDIDSLINSLTS